MLAPRHLHLVAGTVVAPAGLCLSVMVSVTELLATAIAVGLVALVTTAGALLAADWSAGAESRKAWAEVAPPWAAQSPPDAQPELAPIEARYWAVRDRDALCDIFRFRRLAPPAPASEEPLSANAPSPPTSLARCLLR